MNFDELVKSQKLGDKVKSSRCKAREWLAERSRYAFYSFSSCFFVIFVVAMKRNAADGLFTKSLNINSMIMRVWYNPGL